MGTSEESTESTQEIGPVPQAPSSSVVRGNGNGRGRPRGRTGEMVDALLKTLSPDFVKTGMIHLVYSTDTDKRLIIRSIMLLNV